MTNENLGPEAAAGVGVTDLAGSSLPSKEQSLRQRAMSFLSTGVNERYWNRATAYELVREMLDAQWNETAQPAEARPPTAHEPAARFLSNDASGVMCVRAEHYDEIVAQRDQLWTERDELRETLAHMVRGQSSGETPAPLGILDAKVTVCSECFTACCWQGIFYCDKSKEASTTTKTVGQLRAMGPLESPENWFRSPTTGQVDEANLAAYHSAVKTSSPLCEPKCFDWPKCECGRGMP